MLCSVFKLSLEDKSSRGEVIAATRVGPNAMEL